MRCARQWGFGNSPSVCLRGWLLLTANGICLSSILFPLAFNVAYSGASAILTLHRCP